MIQQRYLLYGLFAALAIAQTRSAGGNGGEEGLAGLTFPNATASDYGDCSTACASAVNGTTVCGDMTKNAQRELDCFCSTSFMENGTSCYACLVLQNDTSTYDLVSEIADVYSACVDDTPAQPCPISCGGVYSAVNCLNTTAASPTGSANTGSTCYCTAAFSNSVVNCSTCLAPYSAEVAEELLELAVNCPNAQDIPGLGNLTAGGAMGGGGGAAGGAGQEGPISLGLPSSGSSSYAGFFTAASGSAPNAAALATATSTSDSAQMSSMASGASPSSPMVSGAAASAGTQSTFSQASALKIELTVFGAAIGMAFMLW